MRLKRPAAYNIGVDLDAEVIAGWLSFSGGSGAHRSIPRSRPGGNATAAGPAETVGVAACDLVVTVDLPRSADAGENAAARRRRTAEPPRVASGGGLAASVPASTGGGLAAPGSAGGCAAGSSRFRFLRGDGLTFLASYPFQPADLIYCDPPYLMETRSSGRLYRHEMSDEQHAELLATILELPCRVMISGYWSEMYASMLKRWNSISFEAMTRGGMATEWLWFNYAPPVELHDYRFLGEGNRERTDLKRQKERWVRRLERMPVLKKRALLSAISTHCGNAAGIRPFEIS